MRTAVNPEETIYLDANASTPLLPEVAAALTEAAANTYANPSSDHVAGRCAADAVARARASVAALLGANPDEIIFTSGATEAINLGLQGVVKALESRPVPIVCSPIEHPAVLATVEYMESEGLAIRYKVCVDRVGRITPDVVAAAMPFGRCVVCLAHGNNEIGTLNDIRELSGVVADRGGFVFVDAAQTGGYCLPDVRQCPVDVMCLSGHKMHGPKGVGALFVREGTRLQRLLHGAGQERGLRPGTENVPAIVGFGAAAEMAVRERGRRAEVVTGLRYRFLEILRGEAIDLRINGDPDARLPGNLSITFHGIEGAALRRLLPHLCFSQGSACASASGRPSHVLRGIGLSEDECAWTIRIGLSAANTVDEVENAARAVAAACKRLKPPRMSKSKE